MRVYDMATTYTISPVTGLPTYSTPNISAQYSGVVGADGSWLMSGLTFGWTVAHPSTGVYTVTHVLGTVNYGMDVHIVTPATGVILVTSTDANSFTVALTNDPNSDGSRVPFDASFGFTLTLP